MAQFQSLNNHTLKKNVEPEVYQTFESAELKPKELLKKRSNSD